MSCDLDGDYGIPFIGFTPAYWPMTLVSCVYTGNVDFALGCVSTAIVPYSAQHLGFRRLAMAVFFVSVSSWFGPDACGALEVSCH